MKEHVRFDRSRLQLKPLAERRHDLGLIDILPLNDIPIVSKDICEVGRCILKARKRKRAVILMMGAHLLRAGAQRYVIGLMEKGYISCVAMNGAGVIHDFEYALMGATTESVAKYISEGQFGLWKETGFINDIVFAGARKGSGLGEAVGKAIAEGEFSNKDISVLAAGYRLGIPVTVHVGIGYDIIHEHPNFDGAAYGAASYTDFLKFATVMERIDGGVVMNFGSAVMAPEVYLKALSMVRNVAHQEGRKIVDITTLVCDLVNLPSDYRKEASRSDAAYYFRPWKTMLIRTVADGGKSYYVRGDHSKTMPALWSAVIAEERNFK